jgi:hypothetical protein
MTTHPSLSKLGCIAALTVGAMGISGAARADEAAPPPASVQVDATQRAQIRTGVALAVVGPLSILAGGALTFVGIVVNSSSDVQCVTTPCESPPPGGTPIVVTGVALMGLGLVSTVVGGVLLHLGLHPKVVPTANAPSAEAWGRRPTWNAERPAVPSAPWTVPIVSATF